MSVYGPILLLGVKHQASGDTGGGPTQVARLSTGENTKKKKIRGAHLLIEPRARRRPARGVRGRSDILGGGVQWNKSR